MEERLNNNLVENEGVLQYIDNNNFIDNITECDIVDKNSKTVEIVKYSKLKSLKNFFTGKKPARSGLNFYIGNRGTGKSTKIGKEFLNWSKHKKGYKEYTDFYTNVYINTDDEHYHHLELNKYKITDYIEKNDVTENGCCYTIPKGEDTPFKIKGNCIICLDELGIIAHARDYKNFPKETINLLKYLRKLGIYMIANSQNYDIDKVVRDSTNSIFFMKKIIHLNFSRKLNKKIVVGKVDDGYQNAETQIHSELMWSSPILPGSWEFTFIPFYTDIFKSFI